MDIEMPKRVSVEGGFCCGSGCLRCPFDPRHTRGTTTMRSEENNLDLHGVRHKDVQKILDDHLYANEPPFKIITGNSMEMKRIVRDILKEYELQHMDWELGSILVG